MNLNVDFNITIFCRKEIRYEHKAGFMRIKDLQTFMRMAYAEVLCGRFFCEKNLHAEPYAA